MGVIAKDSREIKLYYNPESPIGKKTLAYIQASEKKILTIDVSKTKVTGTQWAEMADNLNLHISNLIATDHPDFIKKYGEEPLDMEQDDWLRLLENSPELLIYPIVIDGTQFLQIKKSSDFNKFLEPDGADR